MIVKMTAPEKECEICGRIFTVTNPRQKYCPDCRTASGHKKEKMKRIYAANQRKYDTWQKEDNPQIIENVCVNCGKTFCSTGYSRDYCSNACKKAFHIAHTKCAWCGKPQSETDDQTDHYGHPWFCCPECRKKNDYAAAKKNGRLKKCLVCGKEFIDKTPYMTRKYCSRHCSAEGQKLEREKKDKELQKIRETGISTCMECGKTYRINKNAFFHFDHFCSIECRRKYYEKNVNGTMRQCPVCGKDFFWSLNEPAPVYNMPVCSEKCAQAVLAEEVEKARIEKEKAAEESAKKKREKSARKKGRKAEDLDPAWVEKNGLCGICRTPYADCTRMQTNFRIKPKGAVYHDSKIVKCPLFN